MYLVEKWIFAFPIVLKARHRQLSLRRELGFGLLGFKRKMKADVNYWRVVSIEIWDLGLDYAFLIL